MTRDGTVHDYVGGLADLEARRVRFIGDAATSALPRIICASCASSAFMPPMAAGMPDPDGLARLHRRRARASTQLSRERVRMELLKLLVAPHAAPALAVMAECGPARCRCSAAFPISRLSKTWPRSKRQPACRPMRCGGSARSACALPEDAERLWQRLRLSNASTSGWRRWRWLVAGVAVRTSKSARALLYRLGPERFTDRALLAWARSAGGRTR